MNKPVVFITGAGGFIGRHLVEEMVRNGWFVYALIHKSKTKQLVKLANDNKISLVYGDTTNFNSLDAVFKTFKTLPRTIIHCAGRASDVGPRKAFYETNFCSTQHLVKLFKAYAIKRFVFISTTDIYGLKDFNHEEEHELPFALKARNFYPKYKIESEKWIVNNLSESQYVIVRPAAVWGNDDPTLTARTVDFLKSTPWIIHFGKWQGKNRWPLVHVEYLSKLVYASTVLESALGKPINVLESEFISIEQYYRKMLEIFLPDRKLRTICLPLWVGAVMGLFITFFSNVFRLKQPFADPSLYALFSISRNLDFSNARCEALLAECEQKKVITVIDKSTY